MKVSPTLFYTGLPVLAAVLAILGASALFSGCYTLKQGTIMLGYLGRAIPLDSLAGNGAQNSADSAEPDAGAAVDEENRRFVERVRDIRRFAMEELGLAESSNYTRYVELDREYLAAVVSAAAKDSFTRHEWWYPVVGRMPYKGFFNVKDARREREKLQKKDLDVWVRQVDAFSTLGWFKDPLYSYMRNYSDYRLAELLIHELLHTTVYLKGESQFDEELAEFVGSEGARLYIEKKFGAGSAEYQDLTDSEIDSIAFVAYIRELIAELDTLYKSGVSREEKLIRKEAIIRASQERFDSEYETRFHSENYRGFASLPVNNAYLELYRLYYADGSFFRDLYERSGRDLPKYIAAVKTLKEKRASGDPKDPKARLAKALGL
ncbi:aminopeptidase [Spirochaetia bacterium]|nr:aminopeptidase [Spirochaetia bacterium]